MKGRVILAASLLLLAGCQARVLRTESPRTDLGRLYVYLAPLPDTAVGLRLILSEVTAVGVDGKSVPLELRVREIDGRSADRQRLLAVGQVPPGSYRGVALTIERALLQGEEGEGALLVPKEPVLITIPLLVRQQGATLIEIAHRREGAVRQGFRLEPEFAAYEPQKPVFSKVGYAACYGGSDVAVFDRSALKIVSVIGTGRGPASVAVDEREKRTYVALSDENAVEVIDVPSGETVARVHLKVGDRPESLALASNGVLLCANRDSDTVSVIDGRSAREVDRIPVGDDPVHILVDPTGRRAYVFNMRSDSISVIDVGRRTVIASLTTEAGPIRGAFNRSSDRLYVIHSDSPYMMVVDPGNLTRVGQILVGIGAGVLHVDRDTDLIYLGRPGSNVVDIYDPFSLLSVDFLELPGRPSDMVIDREENRLLISLPQENAIAAVDLVSKRIRGVMDVGKTPRFLGIVGARR